ncbi:methionyl-tRNA formyltransferase [Isachenkonia alkalipeptolytica]|uniref:Formyl transferase N-terminal domain-containing protein n=1 Tax=Isachenkonia alkalipeptolytica TaxID=2565777 RepID=A0AA44BCW7_9CLOT|nr:formyltransferase family protein [Isachenkonia alkalipeptolytica]NBG87764.1 hypothetical protein [Isachenkonia alkalipeptolytica]
MKILYFGTNHAKSIKPLMELDREHQIVGVLEWSPKGSASKEFLRQIYHYGKNFRGGIKTLRSFAKRKNIPHINTQSCPMDTGEFQEKAKELQPELICVSYFGDRIPLNILEIPKYGGINAHGSYLPNYRGAIPWFWQYYHMEKEGGVTIHRLTEREDEGEILLQEKFPIELGLKEEALLHRITELATKLMTKTVREIEQAGKIQGKSKGKQPEEKPTKQSHHGKGQRKKHEETSRNLFKGRCIQRGEKFIDWENWDVKRVYHFLRGTGAMELNPPYLGGFWEVVDYRELKGPSENTPLMAKGLQPGDIEKSKEGYRLICKNGEVRLKSRWSMKDLIRQLLTAR